MGSIFTGRGIREWNSSVLGRKPEYILRREYPWLYKDDSKKEKGKRCKISSSK